MEEQTFIDHIQANTGIIQKILYLYVDDRENKEDLRQEIILQAWQAVPRFKGQSTFSTWLYRVALNTVLTYQRKQKQLPTTSLEQKDFEQSHSNEHPMADRLKRAIKALNDIDKTIITLHLDDFSNDEIADIIGITKNNVAVKLHRIKNELTQKLKSKKSWTN